MKKNNNKINKVTYTIDLLLNKIVVIQNIQRLTIDIT